MRTSRLSCLILALAAVVLGPACTELGDDAYGTIEQEAHVAPTITAVTQTTLTRLKIDWTASSGATKYYVYMQTGGAGAFSYKGTAVAPSTTFTVGNLVSGTQYCFYVVADGPQGASPPSNTVCATISAPAAPTGVTVTATATDKVTVSWDHVVTATKYYVYQSTGAAGPYNFVTTTLEPTHSTSISNLASNTTYCFKVAAETPTGTTQLSVEGCGSTFTAGIEGFWKFNETTSTTVADASGLGRNGTRVGNVTVSTEMPPLDNNPRSLLFSGGSGDAVSIPSNPAFGLTGAFSITMWVRVDTAPSGTLRLIGKRATSCGAVNWELAQSSTNKLHLVGASGAVRSFGVTLPLGSWVNVAVTRASNGVAKLYFDGVLTAQTTFTAGSTNTSPLEIGNSGGCGSAPAYIDFVTLQTRELSAQEVADQGTRPPAPTNFLATVASSKRVNLSWDTLTGATKYFVYKGTASGNQTFFTSVLAPTVTLSDATNSPDTQVSYYVQSIRNGLVSVPSTEQVVRTNPAPAAPTNVTSTYVPTAKMRIDWTGSLNAVKYYVYQSSDGGTNWVFRGTTAAPTVTFTAGSLTAGVSYIFYVIAEDVALVRSSPSTPTTPLSF